MLWMRSVTDALVSDDDISTMVRAPPGHGPVLATDRLVVARLSLGGDDSAGSKADDGTCSKFTPFCTKITNIGLQENG